MTTVTDSPSARAALRARPAVIDSLVSLLGHEDWSDQAVRLLAHLGSPA